MNTSRIRTSILAAGLLLVIGGGGCRSNTPSTAIVTPTPTATSSEPASTLTPQGDKNVYHHRDLGINIAIPTNWQVREGSIKTAENATSSYPIISFLSPRSNAQDQFSENVSVVVEDINDLSVTLADYFKVSEEKLKEFFTDYKLIKNESSTLGGQPARLIIYTATSRPPNPTNLRTTQYFTIKDGKAYIVTITNLASKPGENFNTMQTIAQSFMFKK